MAEELGVGKRALEGNAEEEEEDDGDGTDVLVSILHPSERTRAHRSSSAGFHRSSLGQAGCRNSSTSGKDDHRIPSPAVRTLPSSVSTKH